MSSIDSAIRYVETGVKTGDYPRLYNVIDELEKQNPNFFLRFWDSLMEFKVPKMVRSGYIAEMDADEKNIEITVTHGAKDEGDSAVPQDSEDNQEDSIS